MCPRTRCPRAPPHARLPTWLCHLGVQAPNMFPSKARATLTFRVGAFAGRVGPDGGDRRQPWRVPRPVRRSSLGSARCRRTQARPAHGELRASPPVFPPRGRAVLPHNKAKCRAVSLSRDPALPGDALSPPRLRPGAVHVVRPRENANANGRGRAAVSSRRRLSGSRPEPEAAETFIHVQVPGRSASRSHASSWGRPPGPHSAVATHQAVPPCHC